MGLFCRLRAAPRAASAPPSPRTTSRTDRRSRSATPVASSSRARRPRGRSPRRRAPRATWASRSASTKGGDGAGGKAPTHPASRVPVPESMNPFPHPRAFRDLRAAAPSARAPSGAATGSRCSPTPIAGAPRSDASPARPVRVRGRDARERAPGCSTPLPPVGEPGEVHGNRRPLQYVRYGRASRTRERPHDRGRRTSASSACGR